MARGRRVAYQGEAGAYSDEAARSVRPGARTAGHATFGAAFKALLDRAADAAVLPVENSLAGIVQEVNDQLWRNRGLKVVGEYIHPVNHCLLAPAGGGPVRRAISHPQALAQCKGWLDERGIEAVPFHDTAGAARHLGEVRTRGMGAIASRHAAARYNLEVVAEGIQDDPRNRTRFLVVERGTPARPASGHRGWKASLAFIAAHKPGSLVAALACFSSRSVNLTRLDSRPLPDRPFEYLFYVDFELADPAAAEAALTELEREAHECRLFGTYPVLAAPATA